MEPIDQLSTFKQETAAFGDTVSQHIVPARPFLKPLSYEVLKESWSDEPRQEMPRQMTRPAVISTFQWTNASDAGKCLNSLLLPGALWTLLKRARLNYFAYGRFNFRVRVVLNGTRMSMGKLLVLYNPYPSGSVLNVNTTGDTGSSTFLSMAQLTNYAHFFLDPSDNRTGEFTIPFVLPVLWRPLFTIDTTGSAGPPLVPPTNPHDVKLQKLFNYMLNVGTVSVYVVSRLDAVTGGIAPVNLSVYGWLEDVSLALPVNSSSVPVGVYSSIACDPGTQCDVISGQTVRAQVGSSKIRQEEREVSNNGPVSSIASGIANVASLTANLASSLSLCKPAVIDPPVNSVMKAMSNAAHGVGAEPTDKLTLDPQCNIECGEPVAGTEVDEMDIKYIGRTYSYRTTLVWDPNFQSGQQLTGGDLNTWAGSEGTVVLSTGTVNIYPRCAITSGSATYGDPRPMSVTAHLLNAFQYYKGGSRIKVQAVSTPFHSGRVAIVFIPAGLPIPATYVRDTSDVTYSAILDLTGRTEIEFEIPYCALTPVLSTLPNYLSAPTTSPGWCIGQLQFYVLNPLVSSAATTPNVNLIVYHGFCDDLEVYGPTLAYASTQVPLRTVLSFPSNLQKTASPSAAPVVPRIVAQVGEESIPNESGSRSGEQDMVMDTVLTEEQVRDHSLAMFVSATKMGFASKFCFGERVENLGQLIKRSSLSTYIFGKHFANNSTALTAVAVGSYASCAWRPDSFAVAETPSTNWFGKQFDGDSAVFSHTWLSYFSLIYRFRAGGMRLKVAAVMPQSAVRASGDTGAWSASAPVPGVLMAGMFPTGQSPAWLYNDWKAIDVGNLPGNYASSGSTAPNLNRAVINSTNFRLVASTSSLGCVVAATTPNLCLDFEIPHYSFAVLKPPFYSNDSTADASYPMYSNDVVFTFFPSNLGLRDGVNSTSPALDPRTQNQYTAPSLLIYVSGADDFRFHGLAPPPATINSTSTVFSWPALAS